ncbi:nucleoside deaminase [Devosia sp. BK]|uniref:nucleoside deaminase n=1 Tax=Devosia sp. BK TaxID=2871706 RepID=UPI00293AD144|nr:nucleoside deaminase [Devosia sp. BK]MDV3252001.1 nucleoside deaminase [Devosia sp. BK]
MRFGSDASRSAHHTEDSYRASDSALSRQAISNAENASMREAVNRALQARAQSGKAGIAAAIVLDGQVVGRGENEVRLQSDPTKHAEMVALTEAAKSMGTTDLSSCVMISTLQPCEMCLSAMRFAGIKRVIFGATQEKVAGKYFVFPNLKLGDFQAAGEPFEAIGGLFEDELLPLYENGDE